MIAKHFMKTLSSSTATKISASTLTRGSDITFQNANDSGYIYIGDSRVTTTDFGYRISPNSAISFELPEYDHLYAVSEIDGMKLAVLQTGLESNRV